MVPLGRTELMEATARWVLVVPATEDRVHLAVVMQAEPVELVDKAVAALQAVRVVPHKQEILIPDLWAWQEQEEMEVLVPEAALVGMSVPRIMQA